MVAVTQPTISIESTCKDLLDIFTQLSKTRSTLHSVSDSIFTVYTEDCKFREDIVARRKTVEELRLVSEKLAIPTELVVNVNKKQMTDEFEQVLPVLESKIDSVRHCLQNNVKCATEVWGRLEPLQTMVQ
jgi:hypothetical protein